MRSSRNNSFTNLTVANNNSSGVDITSQSYNNTFINVTGINNFSGFSIPEPGSGNNVILNLSTFNNSFSGLSIQSRNNSIINFVSTHNGNVNSANGDEGWGVILNNTLSSSSYFSGLLKFGNNLVADCKANPNAGIVDVSCEPNALSDFATPVSGINMQNTFVAKINTNDPQNSSETTGEKLSNNIFDWLSFSNKYRFWGRSGSATVMPSPDQQKQCKKLEFCHIWDVSLLNADTVLKNVLSIPTGDDTAVHSWQDSSVTRYLRNAVELSGDGIGNDNGLCESNESCLHTRSIGSYQGSGNLLPVNFVGGQLVNIKLFAYEFGGV